MIPSLRDLHLRPAPRCVAVLATALLFAPSHTCATVESDSLRAVVVTIDGIRYSEFKSWNRRLLSWSYTNGCYLEDASNMTRGVTDPNHAILWGCGNPNQCRNLEGHPAYPMHFELLRKERGLSIDQVAIVTGKNHVVDTDEYSSHRDYGAPYRATPLLVQSEPPENMPFLPIYQGPDSLIMKRAVAFLDTSDVIWMGINLSEYDLMTHLCGLYAVDFDTAAYWVRAEEIYREAESQVLDVLWPFLQTHPRYADRTVLLLCTDHGRHLDDVMHGFHNHGHGWLPDSSGCELNCDGCRKVWAVMAGAGVKTRTIVSGSHSIEDLAATVRLLLGFENPYETGFPVTEVLIDETPTGTWGAAERPRLFRVGPNTPNPVRTTTVFPCDLPGPSPVRIDVFDTRGRLVYGDRWAVAPGGRSRFSWDGYDRSGKKVPAGTYFFRVRTDFGTQSRKLTVLR